MRGIPNPTGLNTVRVAAMRLKTAISRAEELKTKIAAMRKELEDLETQAEAQGRCILEEMRKMDVGPNSNFGSEERMLAAIIGLIEP